MHHPPHSLFLSRERKFRLSVVREQTVNNYWRERA
jgi:hypothetical protein